MRSDTGSICGIMALYLSLFDTILTKSQLKKMTYESMRKTIFNELKMDVNEDMSDRELLELHHKSKFAYPNNVIINSFNMSQLQTNN